VRRALGAQAGAIIGLVLREGLALALIGIGIGVAVAGSRASMDFLSGAQEKM
jgi:ABC-type antimicrobial peptide transport system permease subunit